ncbi:putative phage tail protein [Enterococcus cecorum]|uniref:putative phage tail protein n=1 Tax=Enterococcus cecorum TaxID=44008 RepID=UPI003F27A710
MMIETINLKEMLPEWYQGVYEMNKLMEVEQSLLDELALKIKQSQDNLYVSTADSDTIRIYEQMLKIATTSDDTLESRRFRVLTRLASQKPYTKRYLTEMLNSIGTDVTVTCLYDEYTVLINSVFERRGQMADVNYLIRTIVPANLQVDVRNALRTNAANLKLKQAAALTSDEVICITHDFMSQQRTQQVLVAAAANVAVGQATLTQDFKTGQSTTAKAVIGGGSTTVATLTSTQDYKSAITTSDTLDTAGGVVTADFYTID